MSGWRAALRIARREAWRAKGRSVLVVAMIALPVGAVGYGAVTYDTTRLTPAERADRLMGTTQAVVVWPYDGSVNQHPTDPRFLSDIFVPAPAATPPPPPTQDQLLALLPPGTTAMTDQSGRLAARTATGVGTLDARMLDYGDPRARGIYRPLSGRAPAGTDEVALTPTAARRLGVGLGGTVRLAGGGRTFVVVGTVENPDDLRAATIVLRPGAMTTEALDSGRREQRYLVTTPAPLTWDDVERLNSHGVLALSRYVLAHPPGPADAPFLRGETGGEDAVLGVGLAAGFAILEIVLLAGPAFAVGARRRRRDLALVSASGGRPAHIRRIVFADGIVLGAVAAAVGVALGILAAAVTMPLVENAARVRAGAFRVFPMALLGLAGLAVFTGLLAALVPAWISARQDVVTALAGRRGITRSRRRWIVVGALLGAAGVAVAGLGAWRVDWAIIFIGLVIVELGLVLATPAIVGLVARIGRFLPLAPRIALRDTSRNRTAAAPAISAVMAAVVGSVVIGVIVVATNERNEAGYRTLSRPGDVFVYNVAAGPKGETAGRAEMPAEVREALRTNLPAEGIYEISLPGCPSGCFVQPRLPAALACPYEPYEASPEVQRAARRDRRCADLAERNTYFSGMSTDAGGMAFVVDEAAAAAALHLPADRAATVDAALRAGNVVVDDQRYLENGRVTFALRTPEPGEPRTVTAPGVSLPQRLQVPIALMSEATARSLGFTVTPVITMVATSRMPTIEEQDRAQSAIGDGFGIQVERPIDSSSPGLLVTAIIAAVITLGAAAIATGLAAADGRADLATLAAVGASPRVRRALSLSQAGVIAGLGSLIGVTAGLGVVEAVLFALNQREATIWPAPAPYPLAVPWINVAIALVVVPLVAMLGAGLLTRSRLPIERRL